MPDVIELLTEDERIAYAIKLEREMLRLPSRYPPKMTAQELFTDATRKAS